MGIGELWIEALHAKDFVGESQNSRGRVVGEAVDLERRKAEAELRAESIEQRAGFAVCQSLSRLGELSPRRRRVLLAPPRQGPST